MASRRYVRALAPVFLLAVVAGCQNSAHGTPPPSLVGPSPQEPPPPPSTPVTLTGLVSDVRGSCPSITFKAGNHPVAAVQATAFEVGTCSDLVRGALVEIEGRETNGLVRPDKVRFQGDGPADAGLLADVAGGGYVLFFRHAERDTAALSPTELAAVDRDGTCVRGSELTETGKSDSSALGERFRRYGVSIQKVYASPTCRTVEMARLAFGEFEGSPALLWSEYRDGAEPEALVSAVRRWLSTPPEPGKTVVLISHNDILNRSRFGLNLVLEQAEAAVFRPLGGDAYEYVGRIPKAVWMGRH